MNDQELLALYAGIVKTLQVRAPWVATQIEDTVREGRPVARQVKRSKSGTETVATVVAPPKLREDQFAATEELTPRERALVAVHAIERLLVDPHEIERVTRETLSRVNVREVLFVEPPTAENVTQTEPVVLKVPEHTRLIQLLGRLTQEVRNVG